MKHYITAVISVFCALLYFTPWLSNPQDTIVWYLLALWWFSFAGIITVSYSVVIIGMMNNYIVTA